MDIDGGFLRVEVISIARFLCLFTFAFVFMCVFVDFIDQTPLSTKTVCHASEQQQDFDELLRIQIRHHDVAAPLFWGRTRRLHRPVVGTVNEKEYEATSGSDDVESEEDLECDSEDERSNI